MAKVIEFYVPKRFRKAFGREDQVQPGKGYRILFAGKGASIDSTFWRGHCWLLSGTVSSPAAGSEWS